MSGEQKVFPPVLGGGVENPPGHLQTNISPSDLTTPIPQLAAPSPNGNGPVSTRSPILPYTLIKGISSPIHAQFILNVAIPVFTTTFAHTCSPEDMKAYIASNFTIDHILAEINNPNKRFVLAMQGETCCGFAQLTIGSTEPCLEHIPMKERVELQRIYVGMEFHGGGLGKLLMEAALAMGRAEGYTWVWLGVYEENNRAKRFYEKLGFEMVGTHVFWLGSDEQIDEIYLRKIDSLGFAGWRCRPWIIIVPDAEWARKRSGERVKEEGWRRIAEGRKIISRDRTFGLDE